MKNPEIHDGDNPVSKEEYERLASFRKTLRRFLTFSEQAAKEVGLTPQHHQALLAIMGFPGRDTVTVGELADQLMIHHHSAVGLANRLEAMNLIARSRDAEDQRRVCLYVTNHGRELLSKLAIAHRREIDRLTPDLLALLGNHSEAIVDAEGR